MICELYREDEANYTTVLLAICPAPLISATNLVNKGVLPDSIGHPCVRSDLARFPARRVKLGSTQGRESDPRCLLVTRLTGT